MVTLGIETSCDETACAVVHDGRETLANIVRSQVPLHAPFGGVVPEIASRAHVEEIVRVIRLALEEAFRAPHYCSEPAALRLAMTYWQLGRKDQARLWYEKASRWLGERQRVSEDRRCACREAEDLLGLPQTEHQYPDTEKHRAEDGPDR